MDQSSWIRHQHEGYGQSRQFSDEYNNDHDPTVLDHLPGAYSIDEATKLNLAKQTSVAIVPGAVDSQRARRPKPSQDQLAEMGNWRLIQKNRRAAQNREETRAEPTHMSEELPIHDLHDRMRAFQGNHKRQTETAKLEQEKRKRTRCHVWVTLVLVGAITLAVVVGVVVSLRKSSLDVADANDDGASPITTNDLDGCVQRTYKGNLQETVQSISSSHTSTTRTKLLKVFDDFVDDDSAAARYALCWLLDEQRSTGNANATLQEDDADVIQRFALASIYFHFTAIGIDTDSPSSSTTTAIAKAPLLSKSNWLTKDLHVCEWDYCDCNGVPNDKVTRLFLDSLELDRSIPGSALALLTDLQYLKLTNNGLTGPIPTEFARLTNLKVLWLTHNDLTGHIPTEIEHMSQLQIVRLGENKLVGEIPSEFFTLPNLEMLDLNVNELSGTLPTELGNASTLRSFGIEFNQVSGKIPDMSQISNLEELGLGGNRILGGSVPDLSLCSSLEYINVGYSLVDGTLPSYLWSLPTLKRIVLSDTQISGTIPTEAVQLTNLEFLEMSSTKLNGNIPAAYGSLSKLKEFTLQNMVWVTGTIPTELGLLTNLETLKFDGQIGGTVPTEICTLRRNHSLISLEAPPCSRCACCDSCQ